MAQTNNSDYFLANQSGKDFRDELNEILADIKSNNSSSGPPSSSASIPHVEGQMYYDTDNSGELMVCTAGGNPGTFKKVDTNTQRTNSEINTLITAGITGKANTSHTHTGSTISALAAADTTSGTFNTARLGSGSASSSTFLRGDGSWAAPGGGIGGFEVFTSSGNWTRPSGVTTVWVTVVGGGGGGGSATQGFDESNGLRSGAGGGGGATVLWREVAVSGTSVSVTVGGGGPGGSHAFGTNAGNDGTVGVTSSFGSETAVGGGKGSKAGGSAGGAASGTNSFSGSGATNDGFVSFGQTLRVIPGYSVLGVIGRGGRGGVGSGGNGTAGSNGVVIVAY